MKNKKISLGQSLINKINSKESFTYLSNDNNGRYIVGVETLHKSKNPSLNYKDIYSDFYNMNNAFFNDNNISGVGGWLNKDTGMYYVDYINTYDDIFDALNKARQNNEVAIWDNVEQKEIKLIY
tara:strand:- start:83 stop:454 length:372 start_codon:yes stop_codon:yes gene_type:complete